jgi:FlaA1/EpsC-like NDP-sugar epimerase
MRSSEIFVFKMPAVNITDLARAVIAELGPSCDVAPEDGVIKCVGKRPGEKIHEELKMRRALT